MIQLISCNVSSVDPEFKFTIPKHYQIFHEDEFKILKDSDIGTKI